MADVAVVAHSRKSFGGGLAELRRVLARQGVTDPLWYEVKKSKKAPDCARKAVAKGGRRAVRLGRRRHDQDIRFELDGGDRPAARKLRVKVHPASVTVCIPPDPASGRPLPGRETAV